MSSTKPVPPTAEMFAAALKLFTPEQDRLRKDALGENYMRLWRPGPCPIVEYARHQHLQLTSDELTQLRSLVETPFKQFARRSHTILNQIGIKHLRAAARLTRLVHGHARVILAAHALGNWTANRDQPLPGEFVTHAQAALRCFHAAWPLSTNHAHRAAGDTGQTRGVKLRRSHQALDTLQESVTCDAASWLIVWRLLDYLLPDSEPSKPEPAADVTATFLTCSSDFEYGFAHTLEIVRTIDGQHSLYLDPLAIGLLLLDDDLLQSLRISWACCRQPFRERIEHYEQYALRLQPRQLEMTPLLTGNSAGGIFAVAMYAAACGEQVNEDGSASFAIHVPPGTSLAGELKPEQITVATVDHKSIPLKLDGARQAQPPVTQVLLAHDQTSSDYPGDLATWTAKYHAREHAPLAIHGVSTLRDAVECLLGDSKLEKLLARVAEFTAKEWEHERPQRFIEPHYARRLDIDELQDTAEQRARLGEERQKELREPLLDEETRNGITLRPGHQESLGDQELTRLIRLAIDDRREKEPSTNPPRGARLILAEDANAGKTVFTKRLKHFFASKAAQDQFYLGKPALVCRWENQPESKSPPWPEANDAHDASHKLQRDLELAVTKALGQHISNSKEIVDYALRKQRVVLIFDAADQADKLGPLLDALARLPEWHGCHVIVTGRSFRFSLDDGPRLFPHNDWTWSTLLGFDENQKGRYLDDALHTDQRRRAANEFQVGKAHETLFENYYEIAELLEVPGMIEMARELILQERQLQPHGLIRLTRLKTRCDFYWTYLNEKLLGKAVAERHPELNMTANRERWQMMLAVTAFRMVLQGLKNYSASGTLLTQIKQDVIRYCKQFDPDLPWDSEDKPESHWLNLTVYSPLTDHGALEPHLDVNSLSWRHKGWLEFFFALFLAKYATPAALATFRFGAIRPRVVNDDPQQPGFGGIESKSSKSDTEALFRDVMIQLTNDKQWYWGWRMAAEMPRVPLLSDDDIPPHDSEHLTRSLGTLFLLPARGIRPTELMYQAFYLFEQDDATPEHLREYANALQGTAEVMTEFRRPMQAKVQANDAVALALFASFRPCPPPEQIAQFEAWKAEQTARGNTPSDDQLWDADPCVFWQGSPDDVGYESELPRHRVRVQPFAMQQTTVSRAQYRLFDPRLESSREQSSWDDVIEEMVRKYAGDDSERGIQGDDCPIIMVSWFDAFCFAKFLGAEYRLPSESEWEYGCRAGKDRPEDQYYFGETLKPDQANYGNSNIGRTFPGNRYRENAFGLHQMHGNVWEWIGDWYGEYLLLGELRQPQQANHGPDRGPYRVARGGSWYYAPVYCRSAVRFRLTPDSRNSLLGFRLVRGPSSQVK